MAILANVMQTYSQKGQAEDFEDMIYNVTPWETPVLSAIGRSRAKGKKHVWQIDALKAAATNAQLEGDDNPTLDSIAATAEISNYCQITRKVVGSTGTMEAIELYGRSSELAMQMAKASKELKVDIDFAVCQNQSGTVGTTAGARTSGGMEAWINTNQITTLGGTFTTNGFTTTGTILPASDFAASLLPYTETPLKDLLTMVWNGSTGSPDLLAVSGKNKAKMSTTNFAGIATRFRDVGSAQKAQIISGVDLYVSDFGTHKIVPSRQMRDRTVLALNTDFWSVAYLRPFQTIELAKTGDSTRKMMLAEWTLVSKNQKASGKIANLDTT